MKKNQQSSSHISPAGVHPISYHYVSKYITLVPQLSCFHILEQALQCSHNPTFLPFLTKQKKEKSEIIFYVSSRNRFIFRQIKIEPCMISRCTVSSVLSVKEFG